MQKLVKTGKYTEINKQSDVKFWLNWRKYGAVSYWLSCMRRLLVEGCLVQVLANTVYCNCANKHHKLIPGLYSLCRSFDTFFPLVFCALTYSLTHIFPMDSSFSDECCQLPIDQRCIFIFCDSYGTHWSLEAHWRL